jgi:hypothetical protein
VPLLLAHEEVVESSLFTHARQALPLTSTHNVLVLNFAKRAGKRVPSPQKIIKTTKTNKLSFTHANQEIGKTWLVETKEKRDVIIPLWEPLLKALFSMGNLDLFITTRDESIHLSKFIFILLFLKLKKL